MTEVTLVRGDITDQDVDAVVNAANSTLLGGGGVDGAIHARGGPEILGECERLRATTLPDGLPAGQAVVTGAGRLPARWVIHTVGPVFSRHEDRSEILASAYRESLRRAEEIGARSVAFPAISAGAYGWPLASAADIAVGTVLAEIDEAKSEASSSLAEVRFVLWSADIYDAFEKALAERR